MKKDENSQFKLGKIEIVGYLVNGEKKYRIEDCDKSFCDVCEAYSCNLDFFVANNPEKAKVFLYEVYHYMLKKKPHFKEHGKKMVDVIKYTLDMCSGHDDQYDFLFRGNKLISVKFDKDK